MEGSESERRNADSKRIEVVRPVAVFAEGRDGIIRGKTRNISTEGCSISLDDVLEIGERVLFRIDLGEGFDPAIQSAQVVWADAESGRVGVKFTQERPSVTYAPPSRPAETPAPQAEPLPEAGSIIKLNIEKMEKPLRVVCQEAASDCIMLRTSIPFLETQRKVTLCFKDGGGEEKQLSGTLTDVALEKIEGETVPAITLIVTRGDAQGKKNRAVPPSPAAQPPPPAQEPRASSTVESAPPAETAPAEPDPEVEIVEPPAAAQAPALTASEESVEVDEEADIKESIGDNITPRYVLIVRTVLAWLAVFAKAAGARLGPLARKAAPATVKLLSILLKASWALASAGAVRVKALFSRSEREKLMQRKTRLTMRRQVSRTQTLFGALRTVKWQVALLAVTLLAFSLGIWGLVSLFRTNNDDLPASGASGLPQAAATAGVQPGTGTGGPSYDLWGGGGTNVSTVNVETAAVVKGSVPAASPAPVPPPVVPAEAAVETSPVAASAVKPVPPGEIVDPEAAAPVTQEAIKEDPVWVNGSIRLYVKGEIYGFKHYPLKQPPGIVIDVKGAQPKQAEGMKEIQGSKVNYIKTLKREDGTRFIVIFNGKTIPPFELIAHADRIEVKIP
jgi:hypothetical protein